MIRLRGLILPVLLFYGTLMVANPILQIEDPRRQVMTLFYLSFALTLFLSLILGAAGRMQGLAASNGGGGLAGRLQLLGVPLLHRHTWGDAGRLYAQLFLVLIGPVLFSFFITLITSQFMGFEQTVAITDDGTGLSEGEALNQIADGQIAMTAADEARKNLSDAVRNAALGVGLVFMLTCFTRLVPFLFWRSGGREAPTLAQTWARIGWGTGLIFGSILGAILAGPYFLPLSLWITGGIFTLLLVGWSLMFAAKVGPYDRD